jgi:hypothetical protein
MQAIEKMQTPVNLGEVLLPSKSQVSARQSNFICEICKIRFADGLLGKICLVCQHKISFEKLPPEEQKKQLLVIVPERYINAEIKDLKPDLQKAFAAENDTGILLWGEPGRGKTYAMCALVKKYMADGFLVRRVHYEELCFRLRDTFNPKATQTEWGIIEPLLNCDKLFIEDVGTSKSLGSQESDFSLRTFIVLLDMRLERLRPTFITTNKSVENLGKSFDDRVGDRLRMFQVFKMSGDSLRK